MTAQLIHGDCIEVMKTLPAQSVDSLVTDGPYGIRFMGKSWDGADIDKMMKTKMRKGTTRTDGFERNDGAAFAAGTYDTTLTSMRAFQDWTALWGTQAMRVLKPGGHLISFCSPRTYHRMAAGIEDAGFEIRDQLMWIFGSGFPKSHNLKGEFEGCGTALKPAHEPILLARKPFIGSVADNMKKYGTGALHIDASRTDLGRWPANVIHDGSDEVLRNFPETKSGMILPHHVYSSGESQIGTFNICNRTGEEQPSYGDCGSAARFFYCAKTSKQDRDEGISDPEQDFVQFQTANGTSGKASSISEGRQTTYKNIHPTVKPTALMRYLCRLVTPQGGGSPRSFHGIRQHRKGGGFGEV